MYTIAPGKTRGLQQLANSKGILSMCAADHRESLKKALNPRNPDSVTYQQMVDFKLDLCRAVAPYASAILLDPLYGAGQAIAAGALPGKVGLLVSMEKSGYGGEKTNRVNTLLPGWNVKKARKLGAQAAKLLIYYRPDLKEPAEKQLKLVSRLAEQCIREDMPLLVEPVSYPVEEGSDAERFARLKSKLVIETARQVTALPVDVLKAEFPADLNYEKDEGKLLALCQQLNEASRRPWVILSAGVNYELFRKQVEIACRAGASGFLAGRALWQEAQKMPRPERVKFMETTTAQRLKELTEIANERGTPWFAKVAAEGGKLPSLAEGWYQSY